MWQHHLYTTAQNFVIFYHGTIVIHKLPAGPETVPIKRTFFFLTWRFYHSAVLIWWFEILEKLGARFFGFSASSLQLMHRYQLAVSILVNASPLPSSSIHHQEVTFGTQVAGNWLFHQIPHRTCNVVNDPRDLSSVAACNVVNDPRDLSRVATCNVVNDPRDLSSVATCNVVNNPRDLSSMAIYHVRSTRNVNMTPHPTPPHPISTCNVVNDPKDLSSMAIYHARSTRNVNMPPTPPHPISSVATCNVVNDPRDLSSMAIYLVRSTRNVNMPPHPTPQARYSKTCVLRERFSVRRHKLLADSHSHSSVLLPSQLR